MSWPTKRDLEMLGAMPKERLTELLLSQVKNIWRVDGLYFLGIEGRFGTEAATEIDAACWKVVGKLEARELKQALEVRKSDVASLIKALHHTSWALYQTEKESEISANKGIFRVTRCRTQETRLDKGLNEFPCKRVRFDYLESFAKEFNPRMRVVCRKCPPDKHTGSVWCEWEFTL